MLSLAWWKDGGSFCSWELRSCTNTWQENENGGGGIRLKSFLRRNATNIPVGRKSVPSTNYGLAGKSLIPLEGIILCHCARLHWRRFVLIFTSLVGYRKARILSLRKGISRAFFVLLCGSINRSEKDSTHPQKARGGIERLSYAYTLYYFIRILNITHREREREYHRTP